MCKFEEIDWVEADTKEEAEKIFAEQTASLCNKRYVKQYAVVIEQIYDKEGHPTMY